MILISVKSEVMDTKRQYDDPKEADKYLHFVKNFHHASRLQRMGQRPRKRKGSYAYLHYDEEFKTCIPLRVEIIDTEHSQLSITEFLK